MPKPVKAWAVLDADGQIVESEFFSQLRIFTDRSEARARYSYHAIIRVEIRPVPKRRKSKKGKR